MKRNNFCKTPLILFSLMLLAHTSCQVKSKASPVSQKPKILENLAFLAEGNEPLTEYKEKQSTPLLFANAQVTIAESSTLLQPNTKADFQTVPDTLLIHDIIVSSDALNLPLQQVCHEVAKISTHLGFIAKKAIAADAKRYQICHKEALAETITNDTISTSANIFSDVPTFCLQGQDLMPDWGAEPSQALIKQYPPKFVVSSVLHFMKENKLIHCLRDYNYHTVRAKQDLSSSLEINAYAQKIDPSQNEYLFFIDVKPTKQLQKSALKQKYLLCIDQSNSVERKQFIYYKNALIKAFSELREGDLFNVALVDKEIRTLAKKFVEVNDDNLKKAEKFLDQLGLKKSSPANIYHTLATKLFIENEPDTNYHIILITDGGFEDNVAEKRSIGEEIINATKGRAKLHIATVGSSCEDRLISILSSATGGKFIYSDTYTALARKLGKLFIELANPIATDVRVAFRATNANLDAQESLFSMKSLCKDSSQYWIYKTKSLEPLQVIVQGYMGDEYFRAVKNIIPQEMQEPPAYLKAAWKQKLAEEAFLQFIKSGDEKDLDRALAWIKKHSKS